MRERERLSVLISNADNLQMTLTELSTLGLEDKLLRSLGLTKNIDQYKNLCRVPSHRNGANWLINRYSALLADRVVRMYIRMFGDIESPKPMTPFQLLDITRAYLAIYPNDDMSANRIYYLVHQLKSASSENNSGLAIEPQCATCKKPFVVLTKHRSCTSCVLLKSAKKDRAIFSYIEKHAKAKAGLNYILQGVMIKSKVGNKPVGVK
jgi:hypothetical protein